MIHPNDLPRDLEKYLVSQQYILGEPIPNWLIWAICFLISFAVGFVLMHQQEPPSTSPPSSSVAP